jgi:pSer/pThr/pTyr-binding forkhead associated (FHA) protein
VSQRSNQQFLNACGLSAPLRFTVEGPGGVESRAFANPFVVVGRDPNADLVLDHPLVSRRHAYFQVIKGQVFCLDTGSRTGIVWEGKAKRSGWMDGDREIKIGPFAIRVDGGTPGSGRMDPRKVRSWEDEGMPSLSLELPGKRDRTPWRVSRVLTLFGRGSGCRLRLASSEVSRFQGSLLYTPEGLGVIDLLGRGGIIVNGQPVRWSWIEDGDRLEVGPYRFRVRGERPSVNPVSLPTVTLAAPTHPGVPATRSGSGLPGRPWGGGADESTEVANPTKPELVEPYVAHLANQFGQMQQQMFEQFQQTMMIMARMFETLHSDEMALVREELARLGQLNQSLNDLQAQLATHTPEAASTPALDGSSDPSLATADALARIEAQLLALTSRPGVGAPENGPAPERAGAPPVPGVNAGLANGAVTSPKATATPTPAEKRGAAPADLPITPPHEAIHTLLQKRIAAIQEERQTRWQKILGLMGGR